VRYIIEQRIDMALNVFMSYTDEMVESIIRSNKLDIDELIKKYEEMEEYEMCQRLLDLKNNQL
jgi:hypothetical protein